MRFNYTRYHKGGQTTGIRNMRHSHVSYLRSDGLLCVGIQEAFKQAKELCLHYSLSSTTITSHPLPSITTTCLTRLAAMNTSMDIDMSMPTLAPSLTVTSPGTTTRPGLPRNRVHFTLSSNAQGERVHRTSKPYAGRPERRRVDANGMPIDNAGPPPRSGRPGPTSAQLKRLPAGTPPILKGDAAQRMKEKKASQSKLSEMLRSEEMKQWLRSRLVTPGSLNMGVSQAIGSLAPTNVRHYKMTPG
jgi:hypothetical protein